MPALDTNILVRYLIADDKKQFEVAKQFIEDSIANEALFIPLSVTVELEWVLRSLYEVKKANIVNTYNRLLEAREIEFQDESAIEIALSLYPTTMPILQIVCTSLALRPTDEFR